MKKQRILIFGLILVVMVVVAFFGMNMIRSFKRMNGHNPFHGKPPTANQTDVELIRDWMTIPYISETYEVPPDALFFGLGIPLEKKNGKKSLLQLNEEYFPDQPGVILTQVKDSIKAFQNETHPPEPLIPGESSSLSTKSP